MESFKYTGHRQKNTDGTHIDPGDKVLVLSKTENFGRTLITVQTERKTSHVVFPDELKDES